MQTRKKCEQCNTLNDFNRVFCINCGKYLNGKAGKKDDRMTIWGKDESPVKDNLKNKDKFGKNVIAPRKLVICPECKSEVDAEGGMLPLSCPECGYFFQAGIDKIIDSSERENIEKETNVNDNVNKTQSDSPEPFITASNNGPLKKASKDTSALRIISLTSNNILPEMMKEAGNIIGKNGTVFQKFKSEQQISIWHTITGWYARVTMGMMLFNGVPTNQGVQIKLSVGDLLVIDQEQFMVEIL